MENRLSGYTVVNGICNDCSKPFAKISTIYRCECDTLKLRQEIKELKKEIKKLEAVVDAARNN